MDPNEILKDFLEGKISKRDFCKLGAVAAFFYVVGVPLLNEGQATVTRLIEKAKSALGDADYQNDLIFSVFGDFRKNAQFTPGTAHYLFPNQMHPDDVIAGAVLEKVGSLGITNLKIVDNFFDLRDLEGTIVALGSPMSNFLSRAILAYQFVSSNPEDGIKRVEHESFFELPFEYAMDATQLRTAGAMANRMIEGRVHTVPNWSVWSATEKNMLVPSVDHRGQLRSDYLLVTVLLYLREYLFHILCLEQFFEDRFPKPLSGIEYVPVYFMFRHAFLLKTEYCLYIHCVNLIFQEFLKQFSLMGYFRGELYYLLIIMPVKRILYLKQIIRLPEMLICFAQVYELDRLYDLFYRLFLYEAV